MRTKIMRMVRAGTAPVLAVLAVMAVHTPVASAAEFRGQPAVVSDAPGDLAASSLAGEPGPYRIQNKATLRCLDVNQYGSVQYQPCNSSDRGQRWIIWNGGWVKNQYTGKCMPARSGSPIVTETCQNVTRQYWRYWNGGWFQNVYWGSGLGCLVDNDPSTYQAFIGPCYQNSHDYWDVRIWP